MPSFPDSIFIFILALMLLGPKKLPALARELGKWIGEFRRASNEFKMQMEEEMRAAEQAEKDQKAEAIAASAPSPTAPEPLIEPVPEPTPAYDVAPHLADSGDGFPYDPETEHTPEQPPAHAPANEAGLEPLPIATSGDLTMMPPETGIPVARGSVSEAAPNPGATESSEASNG